MYGEWVSKLVNASGEVPMFYNALPPILKCIHRLILSTIVIGIHSAHNFEVIG